MSFLGRPPVLSRQYAVTPLPLDISDEEFSDPATLQRAVSDLGSDGWNRHRDSPCFETMIRARTKLAFLKDELMEIALIDSKESHIDKLLCGTFAPIFFFKPETLTGDMQGHQSSTGNTHQ